MARVLSALICLVLLASAPVAAQPRKVAAPPAPGVAAPGFTVTLTTPPLQTVPPYLAPGQKATSPETIIAAFLRPGDPRSNEPFEFARQKQATHYFYIGYIEPDGLVTDTFDWPDHLGLFAYTKDGRKVQADYILGHTQCLTGETPIRGMNYLGGKIYWIHPRPDRARGQAGVPGPYTNFLVQSPATHDRCRIVVLIPKAVNDKQIIRWGLEAVSDVAEAPAEGR